MKNIIISNELKKKIKLIENCYHSRNSYNDWKYEWNTNTPQILCACGSGIVCAALSEFINGKIPYEFEITSNKSNPFSLLNQERYIANYRIRYCSEVLNNIVQR